MITTRLDACVDGSSQLISIAKPVTGLGEAPGEIGHDQHPLGIWIFSSRSWAWCHQPPRVEKLADRDIEIIGIRDHSLSYQPTLHLLLQALGASTQRPDHVIDERSNPCLIR
jgi:hypothetical protein